MFMQHQRGLIAFSGRIESILGGFDAGPLPDLSRPATLLAPNKPLRHRVRRTMGWNWFRLPDRRKYHKNPSYKYRYFCSQGVRTRVMGAATRTAPWAAGVTSMPWNRTPTNTLGRNSTRKRPGTWRRWKENRRIWHAKSRVWTTKR